MLVPEGPSLQGKYTRCQKIHGTLPCRLFIPVFTKFAMLLPSSSGSLFLTNCLLVEPGCRKVNSRSVFLGCKFAIAQFLSQPIQHASASRGWIINTASMLGLVGLKPSAGAYCASKGAVVLLTKQIAVEYGVDKIHCNALCPGCKYGGVSIDSRAG